MGAREWLLLLALSALWGGSFFFYKVLVAELPPFTVVLGRVGLAALVLNLLLLARRDPMPKSPRLWGAFLVMGLLNNVIPFTLIAWGEMRISSGLASILNATTPIFTVLAAHVLTNDEKLSVSKAAGVVFGFLGVAVLIGPGRLERARRQRRRRRGGVPARGPHLRVRRHLRPPLQGRAAAEIATGQITAAPYPVRSPPWSIVRGRCQFRAPTPGRPSPGSRCSARRWPTCIYFRILAVAGATNLMLVTFLLPISALLLGVLFLGETVTVQAVGGMALIGAGLAAIDGRLFAGIRKRMGGLATGANAPTRCLEGGAASAHTDGQGGHHARSVETLTDPRAGGPDRSVMGGQPSGARHSRAGRDDRRLSCAR